jgi:acetylornithine deacetylase
MSVPSVQKTAQQWIETLVEFDTTSAHSNLGLIETVRDDLACRGCKSILTFDAENRKANLFCTIPDARGGVAGGLVLSGHTDVVPVAGQHWDTDPFTPMVRDGNLYGRGSADMKGFIGIVLSRVPALLRTPLSVPVHIALSFDEEVGCLGAPLMLKEIAKRGLKPYGCIVGEPTLMQPVLSHKGFSAHRCRVHGRAAHSSLPAEGVNAVEYASDLIRFIRNVADEMRYKGPFDDHFDVGYSTVQTSTVTGGGTLNTVPDGCQLDFMIRNLPEIDAEQIFAQIEHFAASNLVPKMQSEAAGAAQVGITIEKIASAPGLTADENSQVARMMRTLLNDDTKRKVAYGSEAGLFQRAGIPAVVCGPGNILHAHRANEFIALSEITKCDSMIGALIDMIAVH